MSGPAGAQLRVSHAPADAEALNEAVCAFVDRQLADARAQIAAHEAETGQLVCDSVRAAGCHACTPVTTLIAFTGRRFLNAFASPLATPGCAPGESAPASPPAACKSGDGRTQRAAVLVLPYTEAPEAALLLRAMSADAPRSLSVPAAAGLVATACYAMADALVAMLPAYLAPLYATDSPLCGREVGALTACIFTDLAAERAHHGAARACLLHFWGFAVAAGGAARSAFAAGARVLAAAAASPRGGATFQQRRELLLTWARDDGVPAAMRALCVVLACHACGADPAACGRGAARRSVRDALDAALLSGGAPFAQEVRDAGAACHAACRCACARALRAALPPPNAAPRQPQPIVDGALCAAYVRYAAHGGRIVVAARLRLPHASTPAAAALPHPVPAGAHCTPYSRGGWALSLSRAAAAPQPPVLPEALPLGQLTISLHHRARRGAAAAFAVAAVQFGIAAPGDSAALELAASLHTWCDTGELTVSASGAYAQQPAVAGRGAEGGRKRSSSPPPPPPPPPPLALPHFCGLIGSGALCGLPCCAPVVAMQVAYQLEILSVHPFCALPPCAAAPMPRVAVKHEVPLPPPALACAAVQPEQHQLPVVVLPAVQQWPQRHTAIVATPPAPPFGGAAAARPPPPPFLAIGEPWGEARAVRVADGSAVCVAQCTGEEHGPRALGHRMRAGEEVLVFAVITTEDGGPW